MLFSSTNQQSGGLKFNNPTFESLRFAYVPRPGLWKIMMTNLCMSIITLSIWHFWGKTNVRRHIWSCIHINNEPLEYTGTGGELFRGFMLVFLIFILPFLLFSGYIVLAYGPHHPTLHTLNLAFGLMGYLLGGYAIYKARNYQLTRTNWRGIYGNMAGSAGLYSLTYFGSILAKWCSLGWASPVMDVVMSEQLIGDMRFGDAAFKFKGRAGPLYPTYAMCWFMTIFVICAIGALWTYGVVHFSGTYFSEAFKQLADKSKNGQPGFDDMIVVGFLVLAVLGLLLIYVLLLPSLWALYTAKQLRLLASYTRFDGAQFVLGATTGNVILLALGNLAIIVLAILLGAAAFFGLAFVADWAKLENISVVQSFSTWLGFKPDEISATLGLVLALIIYQGIWAFTRPFISQRNIAFVFNRLALEGAIDLGRIRQSLAARPKRGEGLADAFDLGAW